MPVSRLDLIHGWARANAADGLRPATNVFQASWTSSIGVQYYEGVASLASVRRAPAPRARASRAATAPTAATAPLPPVAQAYFVIGVLLFIFFAIVNLSAVFCRARVEKRVRRPTCFARCATIVFAPSYWYLGGVALMGLLTAVAIAQAVQFKTTVRARPSLSAHAAAAASVQLTLSLSPSLPRVLARALSLSQAQITDTVSGLQTLQTGLQAIVSDSNVLLGGVSQVDSAFAVLRAASTGCGGVPDAAFDNIAATVAAVNASAALVPVELAQTISALQSALSTGSGPFAVDNLGIAVFVGIAATLGLYLAFLSYVGTTLVPKPCCASTFRVCNVILMLVFLLTWIFAGVLMIITVVGSDICANPPAAISSIAAQTAGSGPEAAATLFYYTSCVAPNGSIIAPTPSSGAAYNAFAANATLSGFLPALNAWIDALGDPAYRTSCLGELASLNNAVASCNAALTTLGSDAGCVSINNVYQPLASVLCNTGIYALTNVWALATFGCILIIVLASAATRLCWRHPGDLRGDENGEDGESTRLTSAWGKGVADARVEPPSRGSATNYVTMSGRPAAPPPYYPAAASSARGSYAAVPVSDWSR